MSTLPPYFFTYAAAKSLLPGAVEVGNQSPADVMPVVLAAPTLSGNSLGELAPPVHVPHHELGAEAARLLLDQLEGVDRGTAVPKTVLLPVDLVIRASTAPPPHGPDRPSRTPLRTAPGSRSM